MKLRELVESNEAPFNVVAEDGGIYTVQWIGKKCAVLEDDNADEYWAHLNEDGFDLPDYQPIATQQALDKAFDALMTIRDNSQDSPGVHLLAAQAIASVQEILKCR